MFNSRVFLAEFIGTFALVFIGAGAGMAGAGLVGVALAHGLTLAVLAYVFGYISGAHVNPAVTFGLAANGTIKWGEAAGSYWLPQFAGAALAGYVLNVVANASGASLMAGATVGSLTESAPVLAMIVEAVLTFFLVSAVLHTAVAGKGGALAGLAIGLTLAVSILAGGSLTGGSLNPARTFGTAIFTAPSFSSTYTYLIYLMGPLVGSILAVIAFRSMTEEEVRTIDAEVVDVKEEAPAKPRPKRPARKPARAAKK
ncbi:MAG: aquaporin [Chloroflexi bacterium]|nr:aquaporin [Chloroflexota bacterium]MDL1941175.1 aquaporin [Chloroflexi bacterium CFX2]